MSAPLCNTCGEALSTLSHPPSGQERDCPERRETEMAETRADQYVVSQLEDVEFACRTEADKVLEETGDYEAAEEWDRRAKVCNKAMDLLRSLSTPREPEVDERGSSAALVKLEQAYRAVRRAATGNPDGDELFMAQDALADLIRWETKRRMAAPPPDSEEDDE